MPAIPSPRLIDDQRFFAWTNVRKVCIYGCDVSRLARTCPSSEVHDTELYNTSCQTLRRGKRKASAGSWKMGEQATLYLDPSLPPSAIGKIKRPERQPIVLNFTGELSSLAAIKLRKRVPFPGCASTVRVPNPIKVDLIICHCCCSFPTRASPPLGNQADACFSCFLFLPTLSTPLRLVFRTPGALELKPGAT